MRIGIISSLSILVSFNGKVLYAPNLDLFVLVSQTFMVLIELTSVDICISSLSIHFKRKTLYFPLEIFNGPVSEIE